MATRCARLDACSHEQRDAVPLCSLSLYWSNGKKESAMKCYKMHSERAARIKAKIIAAVGEFAYFRQADRRREKAARKR